MLLAHLLWAIVTTRYDHLAVCVCILPRLGSCRLERVNNTLCHRVPSNSHGLTVYTRHLSPARSSEQKALGLYQLRRHAVKYGHPGYAPKPTLHSFVDFLALWRSLGTETRLTFRKGLLPLLKSIQKPTELKKFSGEVFGVDAYGWLHRGAVGCAIELAQDKPTRK